MSKSLESRVWKSNLKAELKPLAAVMADMGNDDGVGIYPSVEYLAWLLNRSERSVQNLLKELAQIGVAVRIRHAKGGRSQTPHYHLDASKLPERPPWCETRKGANPSPFTRKDELAQNGAEKSAKGAEPSLKGAESAPDPSVGSVSEIREITTPRVRAGEPEKPRRKLSAEEIAEADPNREAREELLGFLRERNGLITVSVETKALNELFDAGYSSDQLQRCWLWLDSWRDCATTWKTVKKEIGSWTRKGEPGPERKNGNGSNGKSNQFNKIAEGLARFGIGVQTGSREDIHEVAPRQITPAGPGRNGDGG